MRFRDRSLNVSPFRKSVLFGLAVTLSASVVLIVLETKTDAPVRFLVNIADLYGAGGAMDWTLHWSPVAESQEAKRVVAEVLNFDQAAYGIYSRGDVHVAVYAAYWRPGKMSHRLIATHTPDVCWVGAGWRPLRPASQLAVLMGNTQLPMEYRLFEHGQRVEHVLFAHFVGARPVSYGTQGDPPWHAILTDLYRYGFKQRNEQLFIRISSNRPFEELQALEPVKVFLNNVEIEYLKRFAERG